MKIQIQVEQSRLKSMTSWVVRAQVELSRYGPKSSRVNHVPSRAEWSILSRPESTGAHIKLSWPIPMSIQAGPSPYRSESFEFDIESSGPGPISRQPGQGWYRVKRAQANVAINIRLSQCSIHTRSKTPVSDWDKPLWQEWRVCLYHCEHTQFLVKPCLDFVTDKTTALQFLVVKGWMKW